MKKHLTVLGQYTQFKGRATIGEFWALFAINLIVSYLFYLMNAWVLLIIWTIVLIIPTAAVAVRRLHDINLSGWWLLISFIPGIGWGFFVVASLCGGTQKENKYGPMPGGARITYTDKGINI